MKRILCLMLSFFTMVSHAAELNVNTDFRSTMVDSETLVRNGQSVSAKLRDSQLTRIIHDAVTMLENNGDDPAKLEKLLKYIESTGVRDGIFTGEKFDKSLKGTLESVQKKEWMLGQLINLVRKNSLFAVNSWISCASEWFDYKSPTQYTADYKHKTDEYRQFAEEAEKRAESAIKGESSVKAKVADAVKANAVEGDVAKGSKGSKGSGVIEKAAEGSKKSIFKSSRTKLALAITAGAAIGALAVKLGEKTSQEYVPSPAHGGSKTEAAGATR